MGSSGFVTSMSRLSYKKDQHRLLTIIVVVLYIVEYHFIYENFVAAFFGYADISYVGIPRSYVPLYIIQAAIPIIFFRGVNNVASFFSFFIYILVYVPFVDALYGCGFPSSITIPYGIVFFIAMCLFFITDGISIGKRLINNKSKLSFRSFEIIVIAILAVCIVANIGNMKFVNFLAADSDLYERRAAYAGRGFKVIYYLVLWLGKFLLPLLSLIYIKSKKYIKLLIVLFASILIYMINMQKATLIIPLLIVVAYSLYHKRERVFINYIPIIFAGLLGLFSLLLYSFSSNPIVFSIAAIFIMRTQCIEGMEFDRYIRFFEVSDNPVTHYSHIGIINKITGLYPYPDSIGRMVAGDGSNSNATFWLMDGVAAEGLLGVIIVSVFFILVKSLINSTGIKYDYIVVIFSLLFVFSSFVNVSLFTAFFSGGLLVAFLTYSFVDIPQLLRKDIIKREKINY